LPLFEVPELPIPMVERSEEEVAKIVRGKIEATKGVKSLHDLTVRMTRKRLDVSVHVVVDGEQQLEDAHKIASDIERQVKNAFSDARVTIHTETTEGEGMEIWKLVKETAQQVPGSRDVHSIHIQTIDEKLYVDLHLEVSANMTVKQAHEVADQVEARIKAANPDISDITIHMESASDWVSKERSGVDTELALYIEHLAKRFPEIKGIHGVIARKVGEDLHVVFHCNFDANTPIDKAHDVTKELEKAIRDAYPKITRIDVHEEPV
jgi:divalent metal cation (Fe/Co/Zn/Cd) transporter